MANPNLTDMTEEDAADLQFPKDCASSMSVDSVDLDLDMSVDCEEIFTRCESVCHFCSSNLSEPYVRCAECPQLDMCPSCFATGNESDSHRNSHNYSIVRNEFPLVEGSGWSAREEQEFLNVIQECGFGNWVDVARRMSGRTADECKSHYLDNYVDSQSVSGLPVVKENKTSLFGAPPVPFIFKTQDLEDPPRFATNTLNSKLLAGYNAVRSDFEVNYDNHAESLVAPLKYDDCDSGEEDYELGRELQAAIGRAYNHRIQERMRRRRIIRDHGLIAFRRTLAWMSRYDNTIPRYLLDRLLLFLQLLSGMEFDYIIEGLHRAGELKNRIRMLFDYRLEGLKRFHSVPVYQKLLKSRQENEKEKRQYLGNTEYNWRNVIPEVAEVSEVVPTSSTIPSVFHLRKAPPPLEIRGLPGYDKITEQEQELCSSIRVVPANYVEFKHHLMMENKRLGSLKLAQARVLLKIDVNKTRKIYDFLAKEGYINKPPQ